MFNSQVVDKLEIDINNVGRLRKARYNSCVISVIPVLISATSIQ